jgi:RNA polymerase sigma-70 factor (sigma-E family)
MTVSATLQAPAPAMEAPASAMDFEEYVRTRQDALLRSARRLVPDPVDAQDLVQTALARTFPRWQSIADKGLADAYMRRVMINTRTEWWRARRLEEVPTAELPDACIDDGAEQRADRAMLNDALSVLAPKQRQVVLLRHYRQLSTEETAQALGMTVGTVKSTLHRALARMRVELEQGAYGYGRADQERKEAVCTAANTAAVRPDAGITGTARGMRTMKRGATAAHAACATPAVHGESTVKAARTATGQTAGKAAGYGARGGKIATRTARAPRVPGAPVAPLAA